MASWQETAIAYSYDFLGGGSMKRRHSCQGKKWLGELGPSQSGKFSGGNSQVKLKTEKEKLKCTQIYQAHIGNTCPKGGDGNYTRREPLQLKCLYRS